MTLLVLARRKPGCAKGSPGIIEAATVAKTPRPARGGWAFLSLPPHDPRRDGQAAAGTCIPRRLGQWPDAASLASLPPKKGLAIMRVTCP